MPGRRPFGSGDPKKDDDRSPPSGAGLMESGYWSWKGPRRKRVLLALLVLWLLYLFIKYIPTDVPPVSKRYDARYGLLHPGNAIVPESSNEKPPPRPSEAMPDHYYTGPIKYFDLASSLDAGTVPRDNDRNVLFAASSPRSAAALLPIACRMWMRGRNKVHFAFMGRDQVSFEMIRNINGIDTDDCALHWHDARPNFGFYSTEERMQISVRASLLHIQTFLQLNAIITGDALHEDDFFLPALSGKAAQLNIPLITVPSLSISDFEWVANLDSSSLHSFYDFSVDILIHAPVESSGSLIQLLKSLEQADYFGLELPRLIIELPGVVDAPTATFLATFTWPPGSSDATSKLILRHRLKNRWTSAAEASLRTIESFYPAHTLKSHVLVLSNQVELAPSFYHFLVYALLEYKYSWNAEASAISLSGIALDVPLVLKDSPAPTPPAAALQAPAFLWQTPNGNAALYFGDQWVELHAFILNRLAVSPDAVTDGGPDALGWTTYMLELMGARGSLMMYPSFAARPSTSLVITHDELRQVPDVAPPATPVAPRPRPRKGILTADAEERRIVRTTEGHVTMGTPILSLLAGVGTSGAAANDTVGLPKIDDLPLVSFDGDVLTAVDLIRLSAELSEKFSLEHGGCRSLSDRGARTLWGVDDLFCLSAFEPGGST